MGEKNDDAIEGLLAAVESAGKKGDWPKVISLAEAVLELDPDNVWALSHKAKALEVEKDEAVSGLLDEAELALKKKDLPEELSLSSAALELDPGNFVAWHYKDMALGAEPWNETEPANNDPENKKQLQDDARSSRLLRDVERNLGWNDPITERELERQQLVMEAEAFGNPLSSALFVATFGGLPVFGASLVIEVTFAADWNNWILLGVSAGAMGVLGAVSYLDTGESGTQAAMTAGWGIGFVMLIVAGIAALVRAF